VHRAERTEDLQNKNLFEMVNKMLEMVESAVNSGSGHVFSCRAEFGAENSRLLYFAHFFISKKTEKSTTYKIPQIPFDSLFDAEPLKPKHVM